MEILFGSILMFLKAHYGDLSISILAVAILTFYFKRVKPFLDSMPSLDTMEKNKSHMDEKAKEIIENITSIKSLMYDIRSDLDAMEDSTVDHGKAFHDKIEALKFDINQISSKVETMMFLSIKGEIK